MWAVDPEERRELLEEIDERLDDTPKGRLAKRIVEELPGDEEEQETAEPQ